MKEIGQTRDELRSAPWVWHDKMESVRYVGELAIVLARGELDRLEGPGYAARRTELRRKAKEAARTRDRQAAAASQNEAEESDATEEEATRESTTRRGRPRGGTKVEARIGERLRREIRRGGRPRVGCPQDPKKKRKKKRATPDRSTSCWLVEILRV